MTTTFVINENAQILKRKIGEKRFSIKNSSLKRNSLKVYAKKGSTERPENLVI